MNAKKLETWDIVLVYWVDSSGSGRWQDSSEVLNEECVCECWTAGFFLSYNKDCIKIASSSATSDQVNHVMYIPKVAIKKVQVIKRSGSNESKTF